MMLRRRSRFPSKPMRMMNRRGPAPMMPILGLVIAIFG